MNNQDNKERRKSKRFPLRADITVDGTRLCSSMDISEGGIYLSTIQYFGENQDVEVSIPFKGEQLTVKAQIVHCQSGIGMGIMFIGLSEEQRAKIKELVESIEEQ